MASVTSAGGTTTQNTSRQVNVDASQPESGAPTSDGRIQAAETKLNTRGRTAPG